MGESLDTLVNTERPTSPLAAHDRVANLVSSRTGARGLSPWLEKDEDEEEDWVGKGLLNLGQKTTSVKPLPLGTFGGSFVSEEHRTIAHPKMTGFGSLGGPNTSGETGTSKRAGKIPLGDRPNSPELGVIMGAAPAGLCVGQLKMGMPPVFTASRQQNVKG